MIVQNKIGGMSVVHSYNDVGDVECRPDWSGLHPELLAEIAIRLPEMEDFFVFRWVCTPWRAAATKNTFNNRFMGSSKIPFLMLAEKDGGSNDRQLYSLSRKAVWATLSFPWLKNKRCMDVGFGWVVTVEAETGETSLVKPFTGATIELPNFTTFPGYDQRRRVHPFNMYLRRGLLSADPSSTSNFAVMVLVPSAGLGYWTAGGKNWKMVDSSVPSCRSTNIGYYKGRMFDINYRGHVRVRDPSATEFTNSKSFLQIVLGRDIKYSRPYFVESSSGDLLLVFRNNVGMALFYGTTKFDVMRLDAVKGEYEMMEGGIGKDAIFVGENAAVCVAAADFPGVIKPNCIYFTDDCIEAYWDQGIRGSRRGGKDMGIYNFEDDTIERFDVEEPFAFPCPPLWIFPSFPQ